MGPSVAPCVSLVSHPPNPESGVCLSPLRVGELSLSQFGWFLEEAGASPQREAMWLQVRGDLLPPPPWRFLPKVRGDVTVVCGPASSSPYFAFHNLKRGRTWISLKPLHRSGREREGGVKRHSSKPSPSLGLTQSLGNLCLQCSTETSLRARQSHSPDWMDVGIRLGIQLRPPPRGSHLTAICRIELK